MEKEECRMKIGADAGCWMLDGGSFSCELVSFVSVLW
jgi:hypothetical protein